MIIDAMQSLVKLQVLQQIIYNLLHIIKTFLELHFCYTFLIMFCSIFQGCSDWTAPRAGSHR